MASTARGVVVKYHWLQMGQDLNFECVLGIDRRWRRSSVSKMIRAWEGTRNSRFQTRPFLHHPSEVGRCLDRPDMLRVGRDRHLGTRQKSFSRPRDDLVKNPGSIADGDGDIQPT